MPDAQAGPLAWEDGTKGLQWQGEARRGRWRQDGCEDNRAGVCESEWSEDGGEDGISVGVVCRADYLQDVLRTLPSGVWGEWVRYPFAAVSGVPGRLARRGAAGGCAGIIRIGPARPRKASWGGKVVSRGLTAEDNAGVLRLRLRMKAKNWQRPQRLQVFAPQ